MFNIRSPQSGVAGVDGAPERGARARRNASPAAPAPQPFHRARRSEAVAAGAGAVRIQSNRSATNVPAEERSGGAPVPPADGRLGVGSTQALPSSGAITRSSQIERSPIISGTAAGTSSVEDSYRQNPKKWRSDSSNHISRSVNTICCDAAA